MKNNSAILCIVYRLIVFGKNAPNRKVNQDNNAITVAYRAISKLSSASTGKAVSAAVVMSIVTLLIPSPIV